MRIVTMVAMEQTALRLKALRRFAAQIPWQVKFSGTSGAQ